VARRPGDRGKGAPGTGTLMKVSLAGGTPTTLVSELTRPCGLAVDATSVYWTGSEGSDSIDGTGTVARLTPK
jgi:hypothetical protein